MPALANIRQERFAREYIKSGVASRAYKAAGYQVATRAALDVNASRMLRHAKVKSRIAELRRQMTYKTKISLESLLHELDKDRELARRVDQPSAAIQATVMQAKLVGLMVDRKESGSPGDFAALSAEQVLEQVRKDHGDDAANAFARLIGASEREQAIEANEAVDIPPPTSSSLN